MAGGGGSRRRGQRTWLRLEMPSTKQMASRMLDFPLPFRPVTALNSGSQPEMTVRFGYDLKPSRMISVMCIFAGTPTRCAPG